MIEVYAKEDHIKYDQYTKAINNIGVDPDMQGRLLVVIHQVRVFEQTLLRVMKGLSCACEFYVKLLLNGVYEFLECLRTLQIATEQVSQTFAEKQADGISSSIRSSSCHLDISKIARSSEDKST